MTQGADHDHDHDLMRRAAQGDEDAFTALIRKYKHPVHAFVCRMLQDADEADDVAQEVFIRLHRTADLYRPRGKFTTWLFAIANNLAIDRLRKRHRHATVSGDEAARHIESTADRGDSPGETLQRAEAAAAVEQAIGQLPPDQKTALVLSEYESLSHAEIAEVMHCSVKSAEARIYRAKQFLREKLARWI